MARLSTVAKLLSGAGSKVPMVKSPSPTKTVPIGPVTDQAPNVKMARSMLAGVPMSVRGRRPRLGGF